MTEIFTLWLYLHFAQPPPPPSSCVLAEQCAAVRATNEDPRCFTSRLDCLLESNSWRQKWGGWVDPEHPDLPPIGWTAAIKAQHNRDEVRHGVRP